MIEITFVLLLCTQPCVKIKRALPQLLFCTFFHSIHFCALDVIIILLVYSKYNAKNIKLDNCSLKGKTILWILYLNVCILTIFLLSNLDCTRHPFLDGVWNTISDCHLTNEYRCRGTGIAIDNVGSDIKLSAGSIALLRSCKFDNDTHEIPSSEIFPSQFCNCHTY